MKRRLLRTIGVVTMSVVLGIGSISSFASSNVSEEKSNGNAMKLVKLASENLLSNIGLNLVSDGNMHIEKKNLKDTLRK